MKTEILLDHEPVQGGYAVRALLRITGAAPPASDRPPLDLAVVLDRSGSMGSLRKLEYAREAASLLVRRLADGDTVSLVAYDDDVRTLAARAPGAHRQELLARLAALEPGGMTNLSGGWLRGRELVAKGLEDRQRTISRVLLLTDGLANVGITEPGALRDLLGTAAATGITTTTIGFGTDYDEWLLRALAEAGGGSTYYIEESDQAPAVFEAEIQGLMALAAQNVAVTVAPTATAALTAVHHAYPRQETDAGALRLELGDLYALEPRSLLVEFLIPDDGGAEHVVATLTIEGHVLLPDGGVEKRTANLPLRVTRDEAGVVDPELRRELLLLEAARVRDQVLEDRALGDFDGGARKLREVAEKIAAHPAPDADLMDEAEDLRDMAARYDDREVTMADAKYIHQRSYGVAMSSQRTTDRLKEDRARRRQESR